MAGEEVGGASFALTVGLSKFREQLAEGEQVAGQAAKRMGDAMGKNLEQSMGTALTRFGDKAKQVGGNMQTIGRDLSVGLTAPIVAVGGLAVKAAVDFETAFAGVRKTVDATDSELDKMSDGIREMSKRMPESAVDIAAVAEAAGQLGIAVPNILDFTEVMVGMGSATDLASTEAATSMARLANITQMPQDAFDRLGATIVDLGNKGASTEAEILNMGLRIAGAGHQIGLTEPQILGIAEALSSVGIEAEAGGSAISRVMVEMASHVASGGDVLDEFARVAGMSSTEFANAFNTDPITAINSFVTGLGRVSGAGENVFATLESLGLGEIRVRDALLRLSGAGDILTNSVNNANVAWMENSALQTEVAARNETFAAQWQMFRNKVTDVAISLGEALIPSLLKLIDAAQPVLDLVVGMVTWFTELDPTVQTVVLGALALAAALGPILWIGGNMVTTFGSLIKILGLVATAMQKVGLMSMLANPYVLALVAALAGTYLIIKNWETVKKWLSDFGTWLKSIGKSMWDGIVEGFKWAINLIIKAWNSLSFTVPSVNIPGIGRIGGGRIGVPRIPYLAEGGDIARPGRAIVGDAGPEMLELPRGARVTPLTDRVGMGALAGPSGDLTVDIWMDGRKVAKGLVPHFYDRERINGRPAFAGT